MTKYKCTKCDKIFKKEKELKEHYNVHKKNKYTCIYCGEGFRSFNKFNDHALECDEGEDDEYEPNQINSTNVRKQVPTETPLTMKSVLHQIINNPNGSDNAVYNFYLIMVTKDGAQLLKSENATEKIKKKQEENRIWLEEKIEELTEMVMCTKIEEIDEVMEDMSDFLDDESQKKIKEIHKKFIQKKYKSDKTEKMLYPIFRVRWNELIRERKLTKEQSDELFRRELEEAERSD